MIDDCSLSLLCSQVSGATGFGKGASFAHEDNKLGKVSQDW